MDRNLALEVARVTEAAALASLATWLRTIARNRTELNSPRSRTASLASMTLLSDNGFPCRLPSARSSTFSTRSAPPVSGSAAAPSMVVVPFASTAAIITLSVPSTVGPCLPRMLIWVPRNDSAKTRTSPPSTRTIAPSP